MTPLSIWQAWGEVFSSTPCCRLQQPTSFTLSIFLAGSARVLGEKAIKDMTVNRQVFEQALSLNPILVTSLNPVIGYLKAAEIGKIAQKENRPVLNVALEQTDIPREGVTKVTRSEKSCRRGW